MLPLLKRAGKDDIVGTIWAFVGLLGPWALQPLATIAAVRAFTPSDCGTPMRRSSDGVPMVRSLGWPGAGNTAGP